MTDTDDREIAPEVIAALGGPLSRRPAADAATEATATVIRKVQGVLEVYTWTTPGCARPWTAPPPASRPCCAEPRPPEAQTARLLRAVRLLTEPDVPQPTTESDSPASRAQSGNGERQRSST